MSAGVYGGLFAFQDQLKVGDAASLVEDQQQKLLADTIPPRPGARPLVFIDYDPLTMRALGQPATIPHASMATLLKQAQQMKPWAVILDIDSTWSPCVQECNELATAVAHLADSGALVLLQRGQLQATKGGSPLLRPTPLDAALRDNPRILWVSNRLIPGGDGIVRRELPWSVACLGSEARALSAPSVALWSAQQGTLPELRAFLADEAAKGAAFCARSAREVLYRPKGLLPGTNVEYRYAGRIRYTLSWEPKVTDLVSNAGAEGPQLRVIDAWRLLNGTAQLGPQVARGAVVIIGSSAPDRLDSVRTPLGDMPGAMELANSVRAALEFGPSRQSGFWAGLFLVMGMTGISIAITFAVVVYLPANWSKYGDIFVPIIIAILSWLALIVIEASAAALPLVLQQFTVSVITRILLAPRSATPMLDGEVP